MPVSGGVPDTEIPAGMLARRLVGGAAKQKTGGVDAMIALMGKSTEAPNTSRANGDEDRKAGQTGQPGGGRREQAAEGKPRARRAGRAGQTAQAGRRWARAKPGPNRWTHPSPEGWGGRLGPSLQ